MRRWPTDPGNAGFHRSPGHKDDRVRFPPEPPDNGGLRNRKGREIRPRLSVRKSRHPNARFPHPVTDADKGSHGSLSGGASILAVGFPSQRKRKHLRKLASSEAVSNSISWKRYSHAAMSAVFHPIIRQLNHISFFIDSTEWVKEKRVGDVNSLCFLSAEQVRPRQAIQESPWGAPLR